jgi:hypothetical protein
VVEIIFSFFSFFALGLNYDIDKLIKLNSKQIYIHTHIGPTSRFRLLKPVPILIAHLLLTIKKNIKVFFFIFKKRFKYRFGPQPLAFVSNRSLTF